MLHTSTFSAHTPYNMLWKYYKGIAPNFKERNMSEKNILIAGGDIRQIYCARQMSSRNNIFYTGIDKTYFSGISGVSPAEVKCSYAVLPVPPPDESGRIFTPLYSETLYASDIEAMLTDDAVIFTGIEAEKTAAFFPSHSVYSYMDREELALRNAISTAEGAILIALEQLPVTLNRLPVLIVGMGRIGTALAHILKGFGADITAAVRSSTASAKAEMTGLKWIYTDDITGEFSLVINTAPNLVFTGEQLEKFTEDTLFIDLASKPGGFDFKAAEKMGRKVIQALGLPGRTAPVTAGYTQADTIITMLYQSLKQQ